MDKLKELHPTWEFFGELWLSWIWIDTHSRTDVEMSVERARARGVPIRDGAMGYEKPTFIRVAVRSPGKQDVLFQALSF